MDDFTRIKGLSDRRRLPRLGKIRSMLDYLKALLGSFAMVPLKLKREARQSFHDSIKSVHYPVVIMFEGNTDSVKSLRSGGLFLEHNPEIRTEPAAGDDGDFPSVEEEVKILKERGMAG